MSAEDQLRETVDARRAAGWSNGIVMVSGALIGMIPATTSWRAPFSLEWEEIGLGFWVWLDDRVKKLEAAARHRRERRNPADSRRRRPRRAQRPTLRSSLQSLTFWGP